MQHPSFIGTPYRLLHYSKEITLISSQTKSPPSNTSLGKHDMNAILTYMYQCMHKWVPFCDKHTQKSSKARDVCVCLSVCLSKRVGVAQFATAIKNKGETKAYIILCILSMLLAQKEHRTMYTFRAVGIKEHHTMYTFYTIGIKE